MRCLSVLIYRRQTPVLAYFFFFNDTATTEIYTLSLHDALPISPDTFTSRMAATWGGTVPRVVERDGRKWWVSGDAVLGPYGVYGPGVTGGKRGWILAPAGFGPGKHTPPSEPVEWPVEQSRGSRSGG